MSDHVVGVANTLLKNGQMKRIEIDGQGILLTRVDGQYYAVAGNCTHYGGPLDEGVLKGHTVMCPWHHACFDVRSGSRLEPPALNNLPHYPVRIDGDQVVVTLEQDNESEPQGKADPADKRTFVIVGGGSAGNAAAEELRRSGYQGKIIMISSVPDVPVDRPNLSKDYLAGKAEPSWIPLRGDQSWYEARDIELRLNTSVTKIEPLDHRLTLDNGNTLVYDKLLLATGGIARRLDKITNGHLEGIYTLRTLADADRIIAAAEKGKQAIVIGASFIGMEAAASLAARGLSVTVVAPEPVPFSRILGDEIGKMLRKEHEDNGVKFHLGSEIIRFFGMDGHVIGLELKDGKVVDGAFVIAGVGVRPATDFLAKSGIALDSGDRSVTVNANLQSSESDVFAAGDIARWDTPDFDDVRIEHWRVAEQQGIVAAHNMLGGDEDYNDHVPFFWSNQWSVILDYVGHAQSWDEIIYRGKPADKKFIAFYVEGGKLLAAAGCGHDKEMCAIELILRDKLPLTLDQMRDELFDLVQHAGA